VAESALLDVGSATGSRMLSDLQLVLEATGVGMWSYDPEDNMFRLDATCRALFDLDDDDSMNFETLRRRIHPDDLADYWDAAQQTVDGGFFSTSYRVIHRDGMVRFLCGRGRAMPTETGRAPIIKGVCIDVTEKQYLEERLQVTESRMQQLVDGVPGLFSCIDRDYRVQFMSSRYREIFGRSMVELLGKSMRELIGEEMFSERKARYDRALAGQTVSHEGSRVMPDSSERYYAITHQPYRDHNGNIQGVISLAIDITERRAIERALEIKSDELSRSNHDLEQFAYVASHDLKAPLRAIEVLAEWLREDLCDYEEGEVQENLALLKKRTGRLNRLLDDLLAYSRSGRQVGDLRRVDTREMAEDIGTILGGPATLRVIADESLPVLTTYHAPLEQVLRNLINNAIKHHPTGEGQIRVSAQDRGDSVMFAVEDDGEGIPEEYAEKVFQMFQTLQPRDEREGSGMGLAIVKRIIDWQNGRIWFHPGPGGRGTVFKFIWNKLDEDDNPGRSTDNDHEGHHDRKHSAR